MRWKDVQARLQRQQHVWFTFYQPIEPLKLSEMFHLSISFMCCDLEGGGGEEGGVAAYPDNTLSLTPSQAL